MGAVLLDLVIPGQPCGKARHRSRVITPKDGKPFVQNYVDPKDKNVTWERFAGACFREAWAGRPPIDGVPVFVFIEAVGKRPQGISKVLGSGRLWRLAKPDGDNVKKGICDALVEGGVLRDDKICARKLVDSFIAADGEAPHTRVRVEELDPLPVVPWPEKVRAKSAPASPRLF